MAHEQRRGKRSALLIGINQYGSTTMRDLWGCVKDVTATEKFLSETAGITNIFKLTSPPPSPKEALPTLENVQAAFKKLADEAVKGDFIYIHYSGHGTRRPTSFGDLKGDNVSYDECLVLVGANGKLDYLRDVEVAFLLKQITDKGATVTFVLDCCHSGGATRGGEEDDDVGIRGAEDIPDEEFRERDPIGPAEDLEASWGLAPIADDDEGRGATIVQHWMTASKGTNFIAACQPQQKAQEIPPRSKEKQGLLTDCLVRVMSEISRGERLGQLSCDVLYNLVSNKLETHPMKDRSLEQDVVFGGQRNRFVFGIDRISQPKVVITSIEDIAGNSIKSKIVLNAGLAHGVRKDDVFAIYPIDRLLHNLADYSTPLATCQITYVDSFTAKAHIRSNAGISVGCAAVSLRDILKDRVLQPKEVQVQLHVDDVSSFTDGVDPVPQVGLDTCVNQIRDRISHEGRLFKLTDSEKAFFRVNVLEQDHFTISFTPDSTEGTVRLEGSTMECLLSHLTHLTIFYNIYNLAATSTESTSTTGRTPRGITVKKIGFLDQNVAPPPPRKFSLSDGSSPHSTIEHLRSFDPPSSIDMFEKQSLGIQVRNTTFQSLYVEILDLEPSWAVSRTYPTRHQNTILVSKNEGIYFFIKMSMSEKLQPEGAYGPPDSFDRLVVLATPRDRLNFPSVVLPILGEKVPVVVPGGTNSGDDGGQGAPAVLEPDQGDDGRGGSGVEEPSWFVQHLDVRVLKEPEDDM